jgi:hypothetical protein
MRRGKNNRLTGHTIGLLSICLMASMIAGCTPALTDNPLSLVPDVSNSNSITTTESTTITGKETTKESDNITTTQGATTSEKETAKESDIVIETENNTTNYDSEVLMQTISSPYVFDGEYDGLAYDVPADWNIFTGHTGLLQFECPQEGHIVSIFSFEIDQVDLFEINTKIMRMAQGYFIYKTEDVWAKCWDFAISYRDEPFILNGQEYDVNSFSTMFYNEEEEAFVTPEYVRVYNYHFENQSFNLCFIAPEKFEGERELAYRILSSVRRYRSYEE